MFRNLKKFDYELLIEQLSRSKFWIGWFLVLCILYGINDNKSHWYVAIFSVTTDPKFYKHVTEHSRNTVATL